MKYTVTKDGVEIASYDRLSFCINTITNDKSFSDIINSYIDMDVKLLSDYSLNKDLFNNLYEITNTDGKVVWSTKNSKVEWLKK